MWPSCGVQRKPLRVGDQERFTEGDADGKLCKTAHHSWGGPHGRGRGKAGPVCVQSSQKCAVCGA